MFRRKYFLRCPSFVDSAYQCRVVYPKSSSPLTQAQCFSVVCQHASLARVLALFCLGCPSAVARAVSKIVVYSVYCRFWKRLWSHVFEKAVEAGVPSFAKRYSSVCIQVLVFVVRFASSFHLFPGRIFRRVASSACACSTTSARLGASFSKMSPGYSCCFPAIAHAKPKRITAVGVACKLYHGQLSVLVAGFVCSLLAAAARLGRPRSYSTTVQYFFSSAYASKCPVCSCLASEVCAGIANCGQVVKLLSRDVFDAGTSCCRIVFSHLSLLLRSMVVRAVWKYHVPNGSLYLSM